MPMKKKSCTNLSQKSTQHYPGKISQEKKIAQIRAKKAHNTTLEKLW